MTPDDVTPHVCDSGNFDRSICPDPCGMMHSYCATCGKRQDRCAHDDSPAPEREGEGRAEASYCGRGICAAMEGHEGTCAEASGWADVPPAPTPDLRERIVYCPIHGDLLSGPRSARCAPDGHEYAVLAVLAEGEANRG
jgi:hypothetical protein